VTATCRLCGDLTKAFTFTDLTKADPPAVGGVYVLRVRRRGKPTAEIASSLLLETMARLWPMYAEPRPGFAGQEHRQVQSSLYREGEFASAAIRRTGLGAPGPVAGGGASVRRLETGLRVANGHKTDG
jgi:hypothetical protein